MDRSSIFSDALFWPSVSSGLCPLFNAFDVVEPPKKLLEQVRDAIRLKHYSYRTEQTYVDWVHRFILFHDNRHPKDMSSSEIEALLIR